MFNVVVNCFLAVQIIVFTLAGVASQAAAISFIAMPSPRMMSILRSVADNFARAWSTILSASWAMA